VFKRHKGAFADDELLHRAGQRSTQRLIAPTIHREADGYIRVLRRIPTFLEAPLKQFADGISFFWVGGSYEEKNQLKRDDRISIPAAGIWTNKKVGILRNSTSWCAAATDE
jgi:hypothetical protein